MLPQQRRLRCGVWVGYLRVGNKGVVQPCSDFPSSPNLCWFAVQMGGHALPALVSGALGLADNVPITMETGLGCGGWVVTTRDGTQNA